MRIHAGAEDFVLLGDASSIGRPSDRRATDDVLMVRELLAGEVQLSAIRQPVPPVIVDVLPGYMDLAANEFAAHHVMDHKGGSDALLTRRVAGVPRRSTFGSTRLRSPRLSQCKGKILDGCSRRGH